MFKIDGDVPAGLNLHYTRALNLVRIIQEAISNSIKHSAPKNITIASSNENNRWKLIVKDDGKGFDFEAAKIAETGNGLTNMQSRAVDSGFIFTIESTLNKETVITVIA